MRNMMTGFPDFRRALADSSKFEREFFGSAKSLSGFSNQKLGGVLVDFFAVLLITNYFVFFGSIGLTQRHFGSILAE
jgi:hypothetical protein